MVGIIAFNNIKFSPYVFFYTSILDKMGINYEVLILNRMNIDENEKYSFNVISCPWVNRFRSKILLKLYNFYRYKKFLIRKIKKYDFLVVLTTIPSVLLWKTLTKKYKKKYIVDIRDYTYDNNYIFRYFEKKVLLQSALNVVSSKGFINFLPKNVEYKISHNYFSEKLPNANSFNFSSMHKIKIGYVGTISYFDEYRKLIELVEESELFEFHFFGNNPNGQFMKIYKENEFNNIIYHGPYNPEDKEKIIEFCDILYNGYGNCNNVVKYAISNKYYDALLYGKPLIVSKNTTMETLMGKFAFVLDYDNENLLNDLYDWYNRINWDEFYNFSHEKVLKVLEENKMLSRKIIEIINTQ